MILNKKIIYLFAIIALLAMSPGGSADHGDFPNIYIDGTTGGDGSLATPYSDFASINWTTGGDNSVYDAVVANKDVTINLKRGVTWREQLTIGASGSAAHPIIIQAYGEGADPIISGADVVSTWTAAKYDYYTSDFSIGVDNWNIGDDVVLTGNIDGILTRDDNLRIVVGADDSTHRLNRTIESGKTYKITCDYYIPVANTKMDNFRFQDGTWRDGGDVVGSWQSAEINIVSASTTLRIYTRDGGASSYQSPDDILYIRNMVIEETVSNVWQAACTTEPNQVFFDGTRGTNVDSIVLCSGTGKWFWEANMLYIYYTEDPDGAVIVEASKRDSCIYLNGKDYITIQDIQLQYGNTFNVYSHNGADHQVWDNVTSVYAYRHGWNIGGTVSTDIEIKNSTFSYNGADGISGTTCNNIHIHDNTLDHNCWLGDATDHNFSGAIYFGTESIENILVENNTFNDNGNPSVTTVIHGVGVWFDGDASVIDGFQSSETPSIVRHNVFYNNKTGIKFEHTSHCQVYYNLIYDCIDADDNIGFGTGIYVVKEIHSNEVYNNVVYGNRINIAVRGDFPKVEDSVTGNLIKNNVLDGATTTTGGDTYELVTTFGGENDGTYGSGNVYTHNCLGTEYPGFIEWGNNVEKNTYDLWETAYGGTTHSVEADPLMTDPGNDDFTLQVGSPCINRGTFVGLILDYLGLPVPIGHRPDIGAYEHKNGGAVIH